MDIKTTFLQLILYYYGNLSIQLRPINISSKSSLANGAWNLFLCLLISYVMIFYVKAKQYQEDVQYRLVAQFARKPLFGLLYKIGLRYAFPIAYCSNMVYFFAVNLFKNNSENSLAGFLDSFTLVHRFNDPRSSKQIFVVVILLDYFSFIVVIPNFYWDVVKRFPVLLATSPAEILKSIVALFCEYMLNLNILIILGILHYFKYATLVELRNLKTQIKQQQQILDFDVVHSEIRHLANIVVSLSCLLSFPLVNIIFIYLFHTLITLASLSLQSTDFQTCLFLSSLTINFLAVAIVDKKINDQLDVIEEMLKNNGKMYTILGHQQEPTFNCVTMRFIYLQSAESGQIKAGEIVRAYRKHFSLRLFNLCTVNLALWFYLAAFILNYCILVVQTNA